MSPTMKALTYYGEGDIRVEDRPKPTILEPTDAIIRIQTTTICGTDLGISHGKNPEIEQVAREKTGEWNGRILGHEGIGVVEEVGSAVTNFAPGDKVLISCISRCGACENCQKQLYSHCLNGGSWILGYMIDGTLAEYVRTPFADTSLYPIPDDLDKEVGVFLSDALPTGHEIGVQYGEVKPGTDVLIVGAGPVGMGVLLTSQFYSPANIIVADMDDNRLQMALRMGATHTVNPGKDDVKALVDEVTGGRGVDTAIEAVGLPATWELCAENVKEGGNVAVVGVHGKPVNFELNKLWIKNVTITTGLVNANTTGMLLKAVQNTALPIKALATHHFTWDQLGQAWETFYNAEKNRAMKVIIDNS
ncbi:zinc-dependent alcohol dehydrogenase family protein [Corynebacterium qintianiae]|uniref:Zinc-dependent alcohol dehydrogenase family protein n=1 Tax=Corynebacterium qintianiae TaxID=2709392 RepID=A0A7T0KPH3_9CORY|nr:zinc-dependent alcohol dehydrogenase family protein [Corynebacterium qintianiae]QPK83854.1 zinc-dependent alcohol dehydrogenase family protein [Corynebacterium qintianiae]